MEHGRSIKYDPRHPLPSPSFRDHADGLCAPYWLTVNVETDFGCDDTKGIELSTVILVGHIRDVDNRTPQALTTACDMKTGRISSLVVFPSAEDDSEVEVEVVTAVNRRLAECLPTAPGNDRWGCILSRRTLRFVPTAMLKLPIMMRVSCANVSCALSEICVDGICVPARIKDSGLCNEAFGCPERTLEGAMLPHPKQAGVRDAPRKDPDRPENVKDPNALSDPCDNANNNRYPR